ncbi:ATP-binding protein [Streptomyces sp. RS10V-4]|uniref:ATP-binding protein n=1 Tax=Streptomyces rhizoryzae TaxID=2932493 RepID=UPI0020033504|nr:ATP-binding protein [Streptomyces rhizoryzae]MCK7624707.1 ATP-binding protein [Streptomyces rhizoryzae]
MFEVVTVGALTAFLAAVGNGAAGEMGKQVLLSTGALVRRTLGREAPLPASPEGREVLAHALHARLSQDAPRNGEWAQLLGLLPDSVPRLGPGPGLPPATRNFTDRKRVVRELTREATRPAAGRPRVALLHGPPGIGTTAVALAWGAGRIARYPDGQFYVDLRDAAAEDGPAPSAVLLQLLRRMDVGRDRIPPTEAGREELYRRLTAGRRALVVIDHASSVAQVRNLIPATPEVFLLVIASGPPFALEAERIAVPGLKERDAVAMLRKVAGPEKVALAKPQLPALLTRCAGNAFALKAAAMRLLAEEPPLPGAADEPPAHSPVQGVALAVCRRLGPETARLCSLAAVGGWPAFDAGLAGAAAEVDPAEAARRLTEAAEAELVEPLGEGRYRFRPEVGRHLADAAGREHGIAESAAAVTRALDRLLNRALHAAHAALPQSWRVEEAPAEGAPYRDEAAGMAALRAEAANVVRAVFLAREYGRADVAVRLARSLWPLQLKAGYWDEVLPALRIAARCADEHRPHSRAAAALHFQLSHCLGELRRWDEADREARAAVAAERAAGHLLGEASSVELLGLLRLNRWQYEAAYEHFTEAGELYRRIAPGQDGAADLPRALALIERHQGRALCGRGQLAEARNRLESARDFFVAQGEAYNQGRVLTDLAETLHAAGENAAALARISEAERLLGPEGATPHLAYLARLRRRCQVPA